MKKYVVSCLLLAGSGWSGALTPSAGTQITNQASAEMVVEGQRVTSFSNVVVTTVQPVCSASVTPNGTLAAPWTTVTLLPTDATTLRYTVTNTGNSTFSFPLQPRQDGGSARPTLTVFRDDGDDQWNASDAAVGRLTLSAGQSATVWLRVETGEADSGEAYVNLVSSCAGGQTDDNNVARITLLPPPVLEVSKSFGAEKVRPGEETTVTVTLKNTGASASRAVTLLDPLGGQIADGLQYVAGSARTTQGTLEYDMGGVWSTVAGADVRGLRVRLDSLSAGGQVQLTFRVKATEAAENRTFKNVARISTTIGGDGMQAADELVVKYTPAVALGPLGQPLAAGAADTQSLPFALVGTEQCLNHTVRNTGDVTDQFTFNVSFGQGRAAATVKGADGQPLPQPLTLAPSAEATIRVCYVPQEGGALQATVTATGARGTSDATLDRIERVELTLPAATKEVSKEGDPTWTSAKTVGPGDILVYTLTVTNPYTSPLSQVNITDPVPAGVEVIGASDGGETSGSAGQQTVKWTLGTLGAQETRTLKLQVKVTDRVQDSEEIRNVFTLNTAEVGAVTSNPATAYAWKTSAAIVKSASVKEVTIGDQLTYTLALINNSATSPLLDVAITDTPSAGLQYVPGTSKLDGQPLADPVLSGNDLVWKVDILPIGGVARQLTYDMRVTPAATGELLNTVALVGKGANGKATAIASSRSTATRVALKLLNFAPQADILGQVFVDANGNGKQDDEETGVSGARIILAGGRLAQTDAQGRYHFGNVALGTQALRLDPASVFYAVPNSTRTVQVTGLTTVHFPLTTNGGSVGRTLQLSYGDVQVFKTVTPVAGGYQVQLRVQSPRALGGFQLQEALPAGAKLLSGSALIEGELAAGETTYQLSYRFSGDAALTLQAPTVRWKE